jgi:adenosylmethionine-8-amino-7-oxononanoate aminotransferase
MKTLFYGHSYCGNPLGCAAALASLEVFEAERTLENLEPKIRQMRVLLDELGRETHVGAVRQCGFMAGIDIVRADGSAYPWQEETGARICLAARRHGLLTRPIRDTLVLMPPLCFDSVQLAGAVGALRTAIREVCGEN